MRPVLRYGASLFAPKPVAAPKVLPKYWLPSQFQAALKDGVAFIGHSDIELRL